MAQLRLAGRTQIGWPEPGGSLNVIVIRGTEFVWPHCAQILFEVIHLPLGPGQAAHVTTPIALAHRSSFLASPYQTHTTPTHTFVYLSM